MGEKFVRRYRLISVCKTTKERLLQRKLDMRDYATALKVAAEHGLSRDSVYKHQWMHSAVSEASIQVHLRAACEGVAGCCA